MGVLECVGHGGELREDSAKGTGVEFLLLRREGELVVRGERGRRGGRP